MKEQTTVKSMNFSNQRAEFILNFKVSKPFKDEIARVAKMCNMSISSFIRVAVEEKILNVKE